MILYPVVNDSKNRNPIPPLTVYKASAGSGKTFTLAVEYIKLLISNPTNYRFILAVTFTNKATQEMKQRILSKLYGIANALPDSDTYLEKVREAFPQTDDDTIRQRAKISLDMLVHDYSHFRVETIDSFFQRVLRNLARELGLTANLQVMLNDNEVESQAVDNIIANIETEKDTLLTWIMDFVRERMEDDKNWNVIGNIKKFGENIFKDFYKDNGEELRKIMSEEGFFNRYTSKLRSMRKKAIAQMKDFADRYYEIEKQYGLENTCYTHGISNVPGYVKKLSEGGFCSPSQGSFPNSYVRKGIEDPTNFVKKSDLNKPFTQVIVNFVGPLIAEAEKARKEAELTVNSVNLILKNINELRLLGRIEQEVTRINAANNDFPLSSTQKLLHDLIDKHDSPFIYEKIGGQLRFIMIDEFQDTSSIQWDNFKVLLDDCIAHQAGSLIVGDVKQSIYRWRSGDWRLLQNLNEENFPNTVCEQNLDTNYRSERNIVDFNNAFFENAAKYLSEKCAAGTTDEEAKNEATSIEKAYLDVKQKAPNGKEKNGLVNITLLKDSSEMLPKVEQTICMLLSNDVPQKKIAIIVRNNSEIRELAEYFQHQPVEVDGEERMLNLVSDEAFRLEASLAVNVMVRAMHYLTHPEDKLDEALLAKIYLGSENFEDILAAEDDFAQFLPDEFTAHRTGLLSMPLMDLAEKLYDVFKLEHLNEGAYVCAFFDHLSAFLGKHVAGIDDFLEEWESNICNKSIQSDEVDGIRLLTLHKSKGLEFDNLIIPYCHWKAEHNETTFWVQPKTKPYSELPIVPLTWSVGMMKYSIFSNDYQSEHIKNVVDNLNLLYVAFTRASKNLFVIGKRGLGFPGDVFKNVLVSTFNIDGKSPVFDMDEDTEEINVSYGDLFVPDYESDQAKDSAKNETENIFERNEEGLTIKLENCSRGANFMQSRASEEFVMDDEELDQLNRRKQYIETGLIIHRLLSAIHDYTEVDKAIDQLEYDGILYNEPFNREKLKEYVGLALDNAEAKDWFSPHWRVFNECSILSYDNDAGVVVEHRPDRVIYDERCMKVIDFKTGKEQRKHHDQVKSYVVLLRDMGYKNVSGYLWYIRDNNIVKVGE